MAHSILRRCARLLFALGVGAAALFACNTQDRAPARAPRYEAFAEEIVDHEAEATFREHDLEGAFVLLDERRAVRRIVNPALAQTRFSPASTFKIPNTLIGLESGVIADERFALTWDGKHHDYEAWNRDHDLASAMKHSVVWFYQEVARRIGDARMREWVDKLEYGNRDIGGGIDRFWLDGALRISPREQVEFLRRLHERALPVKDANADLVLRLIVLEDTPDYVWRGKTGLTISGDRAIGWLVGFVERGGLDRYVFATLALSPKERAAELMPLRKQISKKLLVRAGALPATALP